MNQRESEEMPALLISQTTPFLRSKKMTNSAKLNFIDRSDFAGISEIVKELFGKSEGAFVNPPFYCDYGSHIEVGKNFFANYNCTLLMLQRSRLVTTARWHQMSHPTQLAIQFTQLVEIPPMSTAKKSQSVTMYGSVATQLSARGVHIGNNVVIGAGSVVTKDIPDWSIAAGNPCKVIRKITDDDKRRLFHNEDIDDEAWADITSRMSF